jgi:hypothetical protein
LNSPRYRIALCLPRRPPTAATRSGISASPATATPQSPRRVINGATPLEGELSPLAGRLRRRFAVDPAGAPAPAEPAVADAPVATAS